MTSEPRKATDVLLDLEKKLDVALSIIRAQDLNIKILSNKLNSVIESLDKRPAIQGPPPVTVEAVTTPQVMSTFQQGAELDPERQIPVFSEEALPMEKEPKGFRRTSRPETFAGDDVYLAQSGSAVSTPKFPTQVPKAPPGRSPHDPPPGRTAEIVVPAQKKTEPEIPAAPKVKQAIQNTVPVSQRVVSAQGKSLFLADVEILDAATLQQVFKTRTNGTGKWMASLGVGNYRIIIRKLEPTTKEKLEATQDIQVDGSQSPLELQTVIIKS